jgi:hypothetical protein
MIVDPLVKIMHHRQVMRRRQINPRLVALRLQNIMCRFSNNLHIASPFLDSRQRDRITGNVTAISRRG